MKTVSDINILSSIKLAEIPPTPFLLVVHIIMVHILQMAS